MSWPSPDFMLAVHGMPALPAHGSLLPPIPGPVARWSPTFRRRRDAMALDAVPEYLLDDVGVARG